MFFSFLIHVFGTSWLGSFGRRDLSLITLIALTFITQIILIAVESLLLETRLLGMQDIRVYSLTLLEEVMVAKI